MSFNLYQYVDTSEQFSTYATASNIENMPTTEGTNINTSKTYEPTVNLPFGIKVPASVFGTAVLILLALFFLNTILKSLKLF